MARIQVFYVIAFVVFGFTSVRCQTTLTTPEELSLAREEEENDQYKSKEVNATMLKLLLDNKDGVSKSELFDMLLSRDDNPRHMDLPSFPEDTEDARAEVPDTPDAAAEFLQTSDSKVKKDSLRGRVVYAGARGEPIGTAAGIMVLATCCIVCVGYIGLIVWRRIYLKRNGLKHELLRNDENMAETRIEL